MKTATTDASTTDIAVLLDEATVKVERSLFNRRQRIGRVSRTRPIHIRKRPRLVFEIRCPDPSPVAL